PSSASSPAPPAITYATPGTYIATLTVTDNQGTASSPATRTISVPDYSLSASPTSQSVPRGSSGNFTVTLTPGSGFVGTVTFSVAGLPSGATASFTPANLLTS